MPATALGTAGQPTQQILEFRRRAEYFTPISKPKKRHPNSSKFTRGFLIVAPGLTIKDRLRVLQPHDPDSYFATRELIPTDMTDDIKRAKIVITNYHGFKLRERIELSKGGRALLQGRGEELNTLRLHLGVPSHQWRRHEEVLRTILPTSGKWSIWNRVVSGKWTT